jgi:hypothetical protein
LVPFFFEFSSPRSPFYKYGLAHASRRKFGDGWLCLLELEEEEEEEEHVGGGC